MFSLQCNPADHLSPLSLPTPRISFAHLQNSGNELCVVEQREDRLHKEVAVASPAAVPGGEARWKHHAVPLGPVMCPAALGLADLKFSHNDVYGKS